MATISGSQAVLRKGDPRGLQSVARVRCIISLNGPSLAIEQYDAMCLGSPINPDKEPIFLIQSLFLPSGYGDAFIEPVRALSSAGTTSHWMLCIALCCRGACPFLALD